MPRRMAAYAALADEHYHLPVYPALINILPPPATVTVAQRYESRFMDMHARRNYTGHCLTIVQDTSRIYALAFNPDGRVLARARR